MLKPLAAALQALALAEECGAELDLDFYASMHQDLSNIIEAARIHDRKLLTAEASPTGADYEYLVQLLGIRAEAATASPSTPEAEGA